MRNREAELQERISVIREPLDQGLRSLPKHDHLRGLSIEYEPVDYQTLKVHLSKAALFTEADIAALREMVRGIQFCEFTQDGGNRLRLSLTILL